MQFPGSNASRVAKSCYVELRVSDSEGHTFPVGDLLHRETRLILVGDAGSGKTTALRQFAVQESEKYAAGTSEALPIYLPLRSASFAKEDPFDFSASIAPDLLAGTSILFLFDGLDEIQPDTRDAALSAIAKLSKQFPNARLVIASRPAGLSPPPPDEFRFYHLENLDSAQAIELVSKLADDPSQLEAFQSALSSTRFLEGLSTSPLLIQLLWEVFHNQAKLPTVRSELYQTVCDFVLSRWDADRGITRSQTDLNLASVHELLSAIAFDAFTASMHRIPIENIDSAVEKYLTGRNMSRNAVDSALNQLLSSGILVQIDATSISFAHLTFMEFYAAKRLVRTPRKLASLLVESGSIAKEVILFAAGMIVDVAPLVEAAVDRRELILAANCLREGRTDNRILEAYVLDQLQRELGADLINKLAGGMAQEKHPQPESIHSQLRRQLAEVRESNLPAHMKGKLFEQFAERLFRQSFNIIDLNVNTENGEIDIILENTGTDPFWTEWGGDIFVECKNWDSSRPLKETAAFSNKVRMSRGKLGFFVSMSGFTEDALRTLRNQVADRDAPLIVPITGDAITAMLDHREKFDLFFRESIRSIKHLHKW